jgi:polyisoprenoid-binding protein YceI
VTRYRLDGTVLITARSTLHNVRVRSDELTGWLDATVDDEALDLETAYLELPVDALTGDSPLTTREVARRLEIRRHPLVHATVEPVTGPLGRRRPVRGELTLHGASRSLDGAATVEQRRGGALRVEGTVRLDMRDFGLRPPSLLALRVRPEVEVRLRLRAVPED